mmetsp:Transcript_13842/g.39867  ORF Transcript_13842/g.39867 Transcript_13842/m.39867 type:complete len:285 (+) Transcript_13842:269-1123(+)
MGMFIRVAAICQLVPSGLPLVLSVVHLSSLSAFHEMPLAMAIYRLIDGQLMHEGKTFELRQVDNIHSTATSRSLLTNWTCGVWPSLGGRQPAAERGYRIGTSRPFRVVPYGDLPDGHPYAEGYNERDPVVGNGSFYRSFTANLLSLVARHGLGMKPVVSAFIALFDDRCESLLTADDIPESEAIVADCRDNGDYYDRRDSASDWRRVVVSGFRPTDTVAADVLLCGWNSLLFHTTETPASDAPVASFASLDVRYPISVPLWRQMLRRFDLESDVIRRGRILSGE